MTALEVNVDERPVSTVETRKFRLQIVAASDYPDRPDGAPRLALFANSAGDTWLRMYVGPEEEAVARREMAERGYRVAFSCACAGTGYGSWRSYLNELDASHIVIELLGWRLSPEEQAALDAVDEYGRRKPTGFRSSYVS